MKFGVSLFGVSGGLLLSRLSVAGVAAGAAKRRRRGRYLVSFAGCIGYTPDALGPIDGPNWEQLGSPSDPASRFTPQPDASPETGLETDEAESGAIRPAPA
jgi:hypothetical protein